MKLLIVAGGAAGLIGRKLPTTTTPSVFRRNSGRAQNRQNRAARLKTLETLYAAERERIEGRHSRGTRVVALDERGANLTTRPGRPAQGWQLGGDDVALVIGGPDGLDPAFRQAAHERIRLSDLTPCPMPWCACC